MKTVRHGPPRAKTQKPSKVHFITTYYANQILHHTHTYNHYMSFACHNKIQFLHVSKPDTCMPNQKIKEPTKKEFDNKTQLSLKINFNVITSTWWLRQKNLPPISPTATHLLPRTKVRDHHMYQPHSTNLQG